MHECPMHPSNVPDLTARQLHAVLAVAEYNSFIAAASFLNTSQPALTRTVRRVEDDRYDCLLTHDRALVQSAMDSLLSRVLAE